MRSSSRFRRICLLNTNALWHLAALPIGISLSSLLMSGTAKKVTAAIGLGTYVATIISALDANKKLLDSIDATTEQINSNWEEYKASHPEIFGNN